LRKLAPLIMLVLTFAASAMFVEHVAAETYSTVVDRVVTISEWGVTMVNDTLLVTNLGGKPIESISIGFPHEYDRGLKYFMASDSQRTRLAVEKEVDKPSRVIWLKVMFPKGIQQNQRYNFTLTTLFSGLIKFGQETFTFTFVAYPVLVARADYCDVTIFPPADSKIGLPRDSPFTSGKVKQKLAVNSTRRSLEAYVTSSMSFNYTSATQKLVECNWAKREITFDPYGSIHVSDSYRIGNLGSSLRSLSVKLPKGAADILALDPAAPLWLERQTGPEVSVSPRFKQLRQNESFTFTLNYRIPRGEYVRQVEWWGLYDLSFNFTSNLQWVVEKLDVIVNLPKGMSAESSKPKPNSITSLSLYETTLIYNFTNITWLHDLPFSLRYKYLIFWAAVRPLGWTALAVAVICVALVATRRIGRKPAPAIPVPVETIRQFITLQDEKSTLRLEVEKLREDLGRGAISKHEYRRRNKVIEVRLAELSRLLSPLKDKLKSIQPSYNEMLRKIENLEAEIEAARTSESQIRMQYRTGKLTREVYDKLLKDVKKRIDKARENLDSLIIALREEAR